MAFKKGFKVLTRWKSVVNSQMVGDYRYASCIAEEGDSYAGIEYFIDKAVRPKKGFGPLAVFCRYEDALLFKMKNVPFCVIFECEYTNSPRRYLKDNLSQIMESECPVGTDFAAQVILRKMVSEHPLNPPD